MPRRPRVTSVTDMLPRILATVVVALAALLSVVLTGPAHAAAAPEPATVSARTTTAADLYQGLVRTTTNTVRLLQDRARLGRQDCVQRFAERQATRMARQDRMFHQDLGPILRECGLRKVGENVAYGFATGSSVVQAWMRSPGHRANILDGDYRLLGVGARRSADGTWYAAQVFGRRA